MDHLYSLSVLVILDYVKRAQSDAKTGGARGWCKVSRDGQVDRAQVDAS